jgi:hypothetical protein
MFRMAVGGAARKAAGSPSQRQDLLIQRGRGQPRHQIPPLIQPIQRRIVPEEGMGNTIAHPQGNRGAAVVGALRGILLQPPAEFARRQQGDPWAPASSVSTRRWRCSWLAWVS